MKFIDRTEEINTSNEGYKMKIVKYKDAMNIVVEFQDKHKAKVHTRYSVFKNGQIKNPFHKSIFNVGYIGQGKYKTNANGKPTKVYNHWRDMLKRCYNPYYLNKEPTYIDCYVCEEWLCFQNFAEWFYKNYYEIEGEKMCLDKDILCKGNKVYSPKTCIFVPQRINNLFTKRQNDRGNYPVGVNSHKRDKILEVHCSTLEKIEYLGRFSLDKPFQAFTCYKNYKENYIKWVANEYKDLIPKKLYDALCKYQVEIND